MIGFFVGAGRFELPTSRTRTVRATKLRYAPKANLTAAENVPNKQNCQAVEAEITLSRLLIQPPPGRR